MDAPQALRTSSNGPDLESLYAAFSRQVEVSQSEIAVRRELDELGGDGTTLTLRSPHGGLVPAPAALTPISAWEEAGGSGWVDDSPSPPHYTAPARSPAAPSSRKSPTKKRRSSARRQHAASAGPRYAQPIARRGQVSPRRAQPSPRRQASPRRSPRRDPSPQRQPNRHAKQDDGEASPERDLPSAIVEAGKTATAARISRLAEPKQCGGMRLDASPASPGSPPRSARRSPQRSADDASLAVRLAEGHQSKLKRLEDVRIAVQAKRDAEELAQCVQFRRKKKPVAHRSDEGTPIHERLYGTAVGLDAEARKRARDKQEKAKMAGVTFTPTLSKAAKRMTRSRTREAGVEELSTARQPMPKDHKSRDASFGVSKTLKPGPAALMGTTPRFTPFAGQTRPKAFALDGSHRPVTPKKSPRKRPPVQSEEPEPEPEQALFLQEAMDRLSKGLMSKLQARAKFTFPILNSSCLIQNSSSLIRVWLLKARAAFRKLDKDSSGEIAAQELKTTLRHMNLHLDDEQVDIVLSHLDKDGDGVISEWEFMGVVWANKLKTVKKKIQASAYAEGGVDLEKLFRHYDRDNSGQLEFDDFQRAMRKDVGMKQEDATDGEIQEIFKHIDSDRSGSIGFSEFRQLLVRVYALCCCFATVFVVLVVFK